MNILALLPFFLIANFTDGSRHARAVTRIPNFSEESDDNSALQVVITGLQSQLDTCLIEFTIAQVITTIQRGIIGELVDKLDASEVACEQRIEEGTGNLVEAVVGAKNDLMEAVALINEKDQVIAQLQAALLAQAPSSDATEDQSNDGTNNLTSLRESIQKISTSITTASELLNNLLNEFSVTKERANNLTNQSQEAQQELMDTNAQVQQLIDAITLAGVEITNLEQATSRANFAQSFCAEECDRV